MFNQDVAEGAEIFHKVADRQNNAADHDEFHAAGAVLSMLNDAILTEKEQDYITRWLEGLIERVE